MLKKYLLFLIRCYQFLISPYFVNHCRFSPNCSLYAYIAINKFGVFRGSLLSFIRILKCNPFYHGDWYDPVPKS